MLSDAAERAVQCEIQAFGGGDQSRIDHDERAAGIIGSSMWEAIRLAQEDREDDRDGRSVWQTDDTKAANFEEPFQGWRRACEPVGDFDLIIGDQAITTINELKQKIGLAGARRSRKQNSAAVAGGTTGMDKHLPRLCDPVWIEREVRVFLVFHVKHAGLKRRAEA